jgi:hypothetical protein
MRAYNTHNTISGAYSAILGGSGNNDNGFAYAGIFGQNVGAVAANMFHIESLNVNAMPGPTTGGPLLPAGTLYWDNVIIPGYNLGLPNKVVFIV